jgi:hypothetical protein
MTFSGNEIKNAIEFEAENDHFVTEIDT